MGREQVWKRITKDSPKPGVVVLTKLHDDYGERNVQDLKRQKIGRLWFFPDGSMYVHYTPTHWQEKTNG